MNRLLVDPQSTSPPAEGSRTPRGAASAKCRESFDPVRVLGCSREEARDLFRGRAVTPGEAEAIAERSYPWRRHLHDPASYWVTTSEAARILRRPPHQVKRLLDEGRLPHVVHHSGVRLMRRSQIEALARGATSPTP